jgi:hypothetical protein
MLAFRTITKNMASKFTLIYKKHCRTCFNDVPFSMLKFGKQFEGLVFLPSAWQLFPNGFRACPFNRSHGALFHADVIVVVAPVRGWMCSPAGIRPAFSTVAHPSSGIPGATLPIPIESRACKQYCHVASKYFLAALNHQDQSGKNGSARSHEASLHRHTFESTYVWG